jgi:hypothetical protein
MVIQKRECEFDAASARELTHMIEQFDMKAIPSRISVSGADRGKAQWLEESPPQAHSSG